LFKCRHFPPRGPPAEGRQTITHEFVSSCSFVPCFPITLEPTILAFRFCGKTIVCLPNALLHFIGWALKFSPSILCFPFDASASALNSDSLIGAFFAFPSSLHFYIPGPFRAFVLAGMDLNFFLVGVRVSSLICFSSKTYPEWFLYRFLLHRDPHLTHGDFPVPSKVFSLSYIFFFLSFPPRVLEGLLCVWPVGFVEARCSKLLMIVASGADPTIFLSEMFTGFLPVVQSSYLSLTPCQLFCLKHDDIVR